MVFGMAEGYRNPVPVDSRYVTPDESSDLRGGRPVADHSTAQPDLADLCGHGHRVVSPLPGSYASHPADVSVRPR
jgi:hypothetical protein